MNPSFALTNKSNGALRAAIMSRDCIVALAFISLDNIKDLLIGKNRPSVFFASTLSGNGVGGGKPAFLVAINHIFKTSTKPKVGRVNALPIVARMTNVLPLGIFSIVKRVAGNMCSKASFALKSSANGGVFRVFNILRKLPATTGFCNLFNKSFGKSVGNTQIGKKWMSYGAGMQSPFNQLFVCHSSFHA